MIFLQLTLSQVHQRSRAEMGLALYTTPPDAIMHHMFVLACSMLIKTCHALLSYNNPEQAREGKLPASLGQGHIVTPVEE